ncbi:hypothetical protein EBB07_21950 [Paenibacillaceae bacterium]|nr:hypothetical protein EBB07_21950 [Paenibacillaceae bacterium]
MLFRTQHQFHRMERSQGKMRAKKVIAMLLIAVLSVCLMAVPQPAHADGVKLSLTSAMVTNESGKGDAGMLVDEQSAAGDPKNGTGGAATSTWFPGWGAGDYPASAYIDLGQPYRLSDIYLYDVNDIGSVVISTGSPGSWTVLFTDPLNDYMTWKGHAVNVTTQYLRVTRTGPSSNVGEIVLYGTPEGGGGGDTTAPASIANLLAGTATSSAIPLSWTAPGDDGNIGTAAAYEIRYSTANITEGNWASATLASGVPAPAAAGTTQNYTLSGLTPNTTYYVAIKTRDEALNVSGLSNIVYRTTAPSGSGGGGKLTLTPAMLLNEATIGDPGRLIDEQGLAGNPKGGTGGSPVTKWDIGYNTIYLPASVVIDLGADYELTDIYLYDGTGSGNVEVMTGTPFSWHTEFVDDMSDYNAWKAHPVSVITRFVRIVIPNENISVNEVVLYGTRIGTPENPPEPTAHPFPTMDQLIGINAFIDDPFERMQVAGFVREYHNWNWDEGDSSEAGYSIYPNNENKFNPSYAGGGWNFDAYYSGLKALGITVSPAIQGSVGWLTTGSQDKPVASGNNPLLPSSYVEHADHMFQYAARYGSTAVADSKLKLAADQPRSTGLNTLRYFENWNEHDKWWSGRAAYFTPYEYAAMSSADYDGHRGTMGTAAGVKNADPNAKLVMSGQAGLNLNYVKALKFWSEYNRDGSFPFDVLNFHHYSSDGTEQMTGSVGISPEADGLKGRLEKLTDYRNRYLPGKEVWLTEFGYDTNAASPQRAPAIGSTSRYEVQADWLVRSYLAAAAAGIDKAAMYMLRDVDANDMTQYSSSGLTSSKETGWVPKISWYYVYTLKNRLTGMSYIGEQSSGNANVKIYKFKDAVTGKGAYVVWCPTSNNTTVSGYSLQLQATPTAATLVTLTNGNTNGVSSTLTIASGNTTTVNVSERPLFVMVDKME